MRFAIHLVTAPQRWAEPHGVQVPDPHSDGSDTHGAAWTAHAGGPHGSGSQSEAEPSAPPSPLPTADHPVETDEAGAAMPASPYATADVVHSGDTSIAATASPLDESGALQEASGGTAGGQLTSADSDDTVSHPDLEEDSGDKPDSGNAAPVPVEVCPPPVP